MNKSLLDLSNEVSHIEYKIEEEKLKSIFFKSYKIINQESWVNDYDDYIKNAGSFIIEINNFYKFLLEDITNDIWTDEIYEICRKIDPLRDYIFDFDLEAIEVKGNKILIQIFWEDDNE